MSPEFDPGARTLCKVLTRDEFETVTDRSDADLVSSQTVTDRRVHLPVLDIDFPAQLVPSSTPGHYHLYLDIELDWEDYVILLDALATAGVIQQGYYEGAVRRGASHARLPEKPKHLEGPEHPLYQANSAEGKQ